MSNFYQYILALGSNINHPIQNLQKAIKHLKEKCEIVKQTNIKETPPALYLQQPNFFNQGVLIRSYLNPNELLDFCKSIEKIMGRGRNSIRYGPRLIDIDIVFF